ncbi:MAG: DUF134 domain-containing protein [Bacteroidota bacterium]|nr:DUF134 domain-containing protein [Bacteroidota bacterium]
MPRPQNNKNVCSPPQVSRFKPVGTATRHLQKISLSIDEYEAIRLADHLGYSHLEAANSMRVSRPTFSRLIQRARKKTADFFINGKALIVEGGNIRFNNNIFQCRQCNYIWKIDIKEQHTKCPNCNSVDIINRAEKFGHGIYCANSRKFRNRKNRN